ncbi:alpha/beta hydrolase [Mycoplasma sp. P36-A1]|uniref:alpha/beta hydrolase n=1 Tax=Mycoplasma sp. P36-A1 TaxID=3252900 RepID=UPI003C2D901A
MKDVIKFIKTHVIASIIILIITYIGINVIFYIRTPNPVVYMIRNNAFPINVDKRNKQFVFDGNNKAYIDLEYPSEHTENKFDLFVPENPKKNNPTIIWVHGGGFVGGDKLSINDYGKRLAKEGYYFIAMNYELAPESKYPTPIIQLSELVKYLQTYKDHNINMNNLFLAGDSAGAQISAQFATIQASASYSELTKINSVINISKIKGVLLYSGVYDIKAMATTNFLPLDYVYDKIGWSYLGNKDWKDSLEAVQINFLPYINNNFPNTFITDGNYVTYTDQAKALVNLLEKQKVNVRPLFFSYNNIISHVYMFNLKTDAGKEALAKSLEFIEEYRLQ